MILGITGVGKSNFINVAVGKEEALVGHSMESCTHTVNKYVVLEGQPRIILVDTPGFGSTNFASDKLILQDVLHWTENNCSPTTAFGGIIYLKTFRGRPEPFFRELQASQISRVLTSAIVDQANMKDRPRPNDKGMMDDEFHFDNTHASAWQIINSLPFDARLSTVQDALSVLAGGRSRKLKGGLASWFRRLLKA